MIMASTMREVLHSFFLICFIMGLRVYPVKQAKLRIQWIIYLSILYSLIIWCFYMYVTYYATSFLMRTGFNLTILHIIIIVINVLGTIIYTISNFYYQERFTVCIDKLHAVDNTLEKLGTRKIHQKICKWSRRMTVGGLIYLFIINIYDIYWWLSHAQNIFLALFIACILNHVTRINLIVDLSFISFLWYVGNRFDKVNEHLQCLLMQKKFRIRHMWNRSAIHQTINNYKRMLWTSMHLHLELRRIARELNSIFEIQIVLQLATKFLYLIAFCYQVFLIIMQEFTNELSLFTWFIIFTWIVSLLIRIYIINYICDNVEYKANKICKTIYQLTTTIQYANMRKEIYQFALQAMHPLKFTGLGLFHLGHKFIWKFCVTITTYVMIMIQFKVPIVLIDT